METYARLALRLLRRSPGFTTIAFVALALSIGSGTAIFSAVNSVLLQPLPFPHSDQLVVVWATNPKLNLGFSEQPPSVADFDHWRRNVNSVERFALMRSYLVNLAGEGNAERRYPTPEIQLRLFEEALQRIRKIPGVEAAGTVNDLPLSGSENFTRLVADGHPVEVGDEAIADQRSCSPDYFRAIGTPLLRGRFFNQNDDSGHPDVVIVNQTLVERVFGDENPTGRRIRMGSAKDVNRPWFTIVGVVADIKHTSLEGIVRPQIYRCYLQEPWMKVSFVVRGNKKSGDLSSSVRRVIHDMDSQLPVGNLQTMARLVSSALAPRRFSSQLLGALAAVALVLAMIGTYGVLSSSVQQRRREIGIRMALGAMSSDVMRSIILEGISTVAVGLGIGVAGALLFMRVLRSLLYDVAPTDPYTYFSVITLLIFAALIAAYMPARRAGKVNPMEVLRGE